VKVTVCPLNEGLSDDFTVLDVVVRSTVCDSVSTCSGLFPRPLYVAVIDNDPAGSVLVVTVTTPVVLNVPDPTDVVPWSAASLEGLKCCTSPLPSL
jgi:hypothetical protein